MPTHKKGHDKDKYYHLAKDQGYRSRAAFKLIQINKRFDFLTKARVLVDLCAAPGGWLQVAQKIMPSGSIIVGVDLLPIKAIRNVKTIAADITTAECRKQISNELQGWKADVFLCDGAPNIGAAYNKDAYVQNELVLAALKTATDHLVSGGTFCTKVYRSTDYNALIWVFQQLFEDVQAMKPNSSRSQSAEIFIICLRYTAPKHIDSKLFDPNHVFKEYDDPGLKKVDVLHKKYDKMNRRHRTGYDESLGVLLRSVVTVKDFVSSKDPIRLLTDASEIVFSDDCTQFKEHPSTTKEILACFADLRVLGKIDFKKLLKWRALMRDSIDPERTDYSGGRSALREEELSVGSGDDEEMTIEHIQESIARSEKKDKKKARLKASKERARQQLGMSGNAFSDSDDLELFSLANASRIDGVGDVDLDDDNLDLHVEEEQEDRGEGSGPLFIKSDDLEDQLEKDYRRYVARKRAIEAGSCQDDEAAANKTSIETVIESRTTTAKELRRERRSESVIAKRSSEDQQSSKGSNPALEGDVDAYVKMLSRQEGDSSEEDEDGDDSDYDSFDGPQVKRMTAGSGGNADGGKWFSNPIFSYSLADGDELRRESAANVTLSQMPKTDKEIRKLKRKRQTERQERRQERRNANIQNDSVMGGFEVTPAEDDDAPEGDSDDHTGTVIDANLVQHRERIRQGMGKVLSSDSKGSVGETRDGSIEIVSADVDSQETEFMGDSRCYDSENEDYDTHDRAMTMALGTLMLRKAKQKALVDASYNRFAWNDPKDLPSWFLDDEIRHNKPQIPVPGALLDQIKGRFQLTGTKEIKKVAEARARKRKRAAAKLKAAKKQATTMAENSELSEKQKLKAISRALKSTKVDKPSKVYVVTRKTSAGSVGTMSGGNKGKLKFVDKRMKKDLRAAKAKSKGKRKH